MTLDEKLDLIIGKFRSKLDTIEMNADGSGIIVTIDVCWLTEVRSFVDAPEAKKDEILLTELKNKMIKEAFVKKARTSKDSITLTATALTLTLKSKTAKAALYEYFSMMGDAHDSKYDYQPDEVCPIGLYAPRDPCYLSGTTIVDRYERAEIEGYLDSCYEETKKNKVLDPMSTVKVADPRIIRDDKKRENLRKKYPFPLADILSDCHARSSHYNECSSVLTFTPHYHLTDMKVRGNALIHEFSFRYGAPTVGLFSGFDRLPNGMRDSIYEILQDYQCDRRSRGCPADWSLVQKNRPGAFNVGNKEVIVSGIFSGYLTHIPTTRRRLFVIDGLVPVLPGQDVVQPIKGTLLYALDRSQNMESYGQLKNVLEQFLQPTPLTPSLKARARRAEIFPSNMVDMVGNSDLGGFLRCVVGLLRQCETTEKHNKMPDTDGVKLLII